MTRLFGLYALTFLALVACTWAWLTQAEKNDPNYGSEEDDGWEVAEIEAAREDVA